VEGETQLYHLREAVGLPGSFRYSPDILMCISLRIPFNHVICNFPIDQAFKTRKAASTTSIKKKNAGSRGKFPGKGGMILYK